MREKKKGRSGLCARIRPYRGVARLRRQKVEKCGDQQERRKVTPAGMRQAYNCQRTDAEQEQDKKEENASS